MAETKEEGYVEVTTTDLLELVERQKYKCALTGVPLEPKHASLDHITPRELGGDDSLDNLQVVHREVNRMKGKLPLGKFVGWCKLVIENNKQ